MFLKPSLVLAAIALLAGTTSTAADDLTIDFALHYYDQDGDHSAVTGGVGTEALSVISPAVKVKWVGETDWAVAADIGVDSVTSASIDAMDGVSGASRNDARAYVDLNYSRKMFGIGRGGVSLGISTEYDYQSISVGVDWAQDFHQKNTSFGVQARYFADTVELYDIDGVKRGTADRDTLEFSASLTQVFGKRTVGTFELGATLQDGFLSSPFQEVILAGGEHVTERLPDSRQRLFVGFRLNHAFRPSLVQRASYRFYNDDFGISSHTLELETHVRLPTAHENWVFPILRYHTQSGSDYFGTPGVFTGTEDYFTADWDLAELTSTKLGLGWRSKPGSGLGSYLLGVHDFEVRATWYDRDDGLSAIGLTTGFGW